MCDSFLAGGSMYDIAPMFGISPEEVHRSVWNVVDAVNTTVSLKIEFPSNHREQLSIAKVFQCLSGENIRSCCGAIDGMLVWLQRPNDKHLEEAGVNSQKSYFTRKKKYTLNLQETCDHKRRFTHISIKHPAASSDFLDFDTSILQFILSTDNYLAPGLCLFGDNAYVNEPYMATPFPAVGGSKYKDNYNFYHSHLRICIECDFGIIVIHWEILRKALSLHTYI